VGTGQVHGYCGLVFPFRKGREEPMTKWHSTSFKGVRYREHPERKNGIKRDRYFSIRYQREGKRTEEGLGWATDGWAAEGAALELAALKKAFTTGDGPARLSEKRKLKEEEQKQEEAEQEKEAQESITFKQFWKETYAPIARRSKDLKSYKPEKTYYRKWIKPVIGKMPFKTIFPLHLEKIKKNMIKADKSPRTIEYTFAIIRQIWNMAKRDGLIDKESPTKEVKLPKIDNGRVRFLTHDEADKLLAGLESKSKQVHDMAVLSLHCGLRPSEIFNLTWGDVDLDRGTMILRDSKNGTRPGFMTEGVKAMFNSIGLGSRDELIFPDRNGRKTNRISNTFQRTVNDLDFNDGVSDERQKVVFYTLRHTYASWLVEAGEHLYTVQKLLGHSTLAMTERYSHVRENTMQSAVKNLEKKISASKNKKVIELSNHNDK